MADRYCDNCEHSVRIGGSWYCGNARAEDYTYPVEAEECCDEWEEAGDGEKNVRNMQTKND